MWVDLNDLCNFAHVKKLILGWNFADILSVSKMCIEDFSENSKDKNYVTIKKWRM